MMEDTIEEIEEELYKWKNYPTVNEIIEFTLKYVVKKLDEKMTTIDEELNDIIKGNAIVTTNSYHTRKQELNNFKRELEK